MIDLHSHILPGIDDGPGTLDGSLELARAAVADGIEMIAATPHVRRDWPTTPGAMERLVADVNAALGRERIPLEVRPGGEIALDELPRIDGDARRRFGLAGNARYLLVETPYRGWPLDIGEKLFELRADGVTPVIAHPERNAMVQDEPERLRPLVDAGALVQLTAASVDGRLGRHAREASFTLLDAELAHMIASDAHTPTIRAVGMSAAAGAVGDAELARWLTVELPGALVRDEPLPARPRTRRRTRWLGLRR